MSKFKLAALILSLAFTQSVFAEQSLKADIKTAAKLVENSQDAKAETLLNQIIAKAKGEERNQAILIFGRMKFQEKKFNESILVYKQIPADSKYWVQSLEERAWAQLNLGDFERAISLYNTMTSNALSSSVGPETYLIGAIADLRICNYKGIFDDIKLFKERFRPRIQSLSKNSSLEAKQDLGDIQNVIKKMHIIEIEAIQRMGLKRVAGNEYSAESKNSNDTIRFPKENEEWLDEVKFDVRAKHCVAASKITQVKAGDKK